jgi:hypothetical protein
MQTDTDVLEQLGVSGPDLEVAVSNETLVTYVVSQFRRPQPEFHHFESHI